MNGTTLLRAAGGGVCTGRDGETREGTALAVLRAHRGRAARRRRAAGSHVGRRRGDRDAPRSCGFAHVGGEIGERLQGPPFVEALLPDQRLLGDRAKRSLAAHLGDPDGTDGDSVDGDVPVVARRQVRHVERCRALFVALNVAPEGARERAATASLLAAAGLVDVRLVARALGLGGGRAGGLGRTASDAAPPGDDAAFAVALGDAAGACAIALDSVTSARSSMRCPHLRHFMRTVLPATFSSAIWYFALHCSQKNFTGDRSQNSQYPIATLARKAEPARGGASGARTGLRLAAADAA